MEFSTHRKVYNNKKTKQNDKWLYFIALIHITVLKNSGNKLKLAK